MDQPLAVIIEDDEVIADIFASALQNAGYATRHIANGQQAMETLFGMDPALILLDLHLPGAPGARVLQAIRADERLKDVRVVITSADATLSQFLRNEADLVLIKPVGFSQLRDLAARFRSEITD